MAIKQMKPTTPGRRGMTVLKDRTLTTSKPLKSLLRPKKQKSGRNNQGRITTRHRGGGAKKFYRVVNFNLAPGTEAVVEHIEYDPNRSANIARIKDQNQSYHYILAPARLKPGHIIVSGENAELNPGNRLPLANIPLGTTIHALEITPGKGAQLVRVAGQSAQLTAKEGKFALVKLPSGEVRQVDIRCMASVGTLAKEQHQNVKTGKAGRNRHRGKRPTVRGVVMNAADHPHGGGEGKSKGGNDPRSPWGQPTLGYKTRRNKRTDKYIVRSRHIGKRG